MIKSILILLIVTCFSCKTSQYSNIYTRIANKGYSGLSYEFSDMGSRNLSIYFLNDSTLKISNKTDIGHNHHLSNFESIYSYNSLKLGELRIEQLLSTSKKKKYLKQGYAKPYQNDPNFDQKAHNIFPNVQGDTIRFSSDFKNLQIREFNFAIK